MAEFICGMSAGMLFPEERYMPLADGLFPVGQLKVREVGWIESALEERIGHPHAHLAEALYVIRHRHLFSREEVREAGLALSDANVAWPPRMGSGLFHRALATPDGVAIFLWVALSRLTPTLVPDDIPVLIRGAKDGEILAISHVCWGYSAWERVEGGRGRTDEEDVEDEDEIWDGGPDTGGMKWGRYFSHLARECGWSYATMGDMTIGQFLSELNEGKDRVVDLAEVEPVDPRTRRDIPNGNVDDLEV